MSDFYDGQQQATTDYLMDRNYANPYQPGSDAWTGYAMFCYYLGIDHGF